ncbi:MAG TPA: HEPN domain-containing protein [Bryobacteraceae bacterium]|nr:HEPN domain-containing protein [Bryobacteraceae bacterium]
MTPGQLGHEETRAWLDRARRDLWAAKLLIAGDANAEALFHCQQAVEKALKAFLTFHERAFRRTHDLGDLSPECLAIDDSLEPAVSLAEGLTQYAWRFRYPGVPYEPDSTEAQDGLQRAEAVVREVERRLPAAP